MACRVDHAARGGNQIFDLHYLQPGGAGPEEVPKPADDLGSAIGFREDFSDDLMQLRRCARVPLEQHLRRSSIVRHGSKRLIHLVCDGARHFTCRGKSERSAQPFLGALALVHHHAQEQTRQRERGHQGLQLDDRQRHARLAVDAKHDPELNDGGGHDRTVHPEANGDPDEGQE